MRERSRPLLALVLVLGFAGIVTISAFGVAGQLPGQDPEFDAAQSQYDEDDGGNPGGGNGKSDDDDDGSKDDEGDEGPGPRPRVVFPERNDCGTFDGQNFTTPAELEACRTASFQFLSGQVTAQQACAGFSQTRARGTRRSDYDACVLALDLALRAQDNL